MIRKATYVPPGLSLSWDWSSMETSGHYLSLLYCCEILYLYLYLYLYQCSNQESLCHHDSFSYDIFLWYHGNKYRWAIRGKWGREVRSPCHHVFSTSLLNQGLIITVVECWFLNLPITESQKLCDLDLFHYVISQTNCYFLTLLIALPKSSFRLINRTLFLFLEYLQISYIVRRSWNLWSIWIWLPFCWWVEYRLY